MDVNPHSLHVILSRIREQVRCPQCGTKVPVDFPAVKVAEENIMLLQLKCESCGAFIVLQVNVTDQEVAVAGVVKRDHLLNVSSTVSLTEVEMHTLRSALERYEGSFERLFKDIGGATK
ncbi:MAG: hypothetical protein PHZ00_02960 [Candidatus Peribacteraceae bacterium]|nr:hypothetical protein [Candidatus Peribacteraceae bacterium]